MEVDDFAAVAVAFAEHDVGDDFGTGVDSDGGDGVNCCFRWHRPDFDRCSGIVRSWKQWHLDPGLWVDLSGSAEECSWMAAMVERGLPRYRRRRTRCS